MSSGMGGCMKPISISIDIAYSSFARETFHIGGGQIARVALGLPPPRNLVVDGRLLAERRIKPTAPLDHIIETCTRLWGGSVVHRVTVQKESKYSLSIKLYHTECMTRNRHPKVAPREFSFYSMTPIQSHISNACTVYLPLHILLFDNLDNIVLFKHYFLNVPSQQLANVPSAFGLGTTELVTVCGALVLWQA